VQFCFRKVVRGAGGGVAAWARRMRRMLVMATAGCT
jgi:hypothetical protein